MTYFKCFVHYYLVLLETGSYPIVHVILELTIFMPQLPESYRNLGSKFFPTN